VLEVQRTGGRETGAVGTDGGLGVIGGALVDCAAGSGIGKGKGGGGPQSMAHLKISKIPSHRPSPQIGVRPPQSAGQFDEFSPSEHWPSPQNRPLMQSCGQTETLSPNEQ
jgi:hypothetical protein